MDLLPLFEWLENTTLGDAVRQSLWLFPVIESFHLVGLAVLGGLVLGLPATRLFSAHIVRLMEQAESQA